MHPPLEAAGITWNPQDAGIAESELLSRYVEQLQHLCVSQHGEMDHETLGVVPEADDHRNVAAGGRNRLLLSMSVAEESSQLAHS